MIILKHKILIVNHLLSASHIPRKFLMINLKLYMMLGFVQMLLLLSKNFLN